MSENQNKGTKDRKRIETNRKREAADRIDDRMRDQSEAEDTAFTEAIEEWKAQHESASKPEDPDAPKRD